MARKSTVSSESRAVDPRRAVIEALMRLAEARGWDGIELGEIALEAGMELKQLRGLFPSKGAMLAGFARMIDDELLGQPTDDMKDEPLRERLFDVMMRRLDAFGPYRAGLARIVPAVKRNPAELAAMNGVALNSWRYMLASANIPTADALGLVRLQGTVLVFSRVFDVWLHDEDAGQAKTLAALDRELDRAGKIMGGAEKLHKLTAPLRGLASALCRVGDRTARRRARADGSSSGEAAA
jgi:AcrR family transcriptional regulator